MSLTHKSDTCTGRWGATTAGGNPYWICNRCGATSYNCVATHEAAVRENLMGNMLDQLTKEGRKLLASDRTVP